MSEYIYSPVHVAVFTDCHHRLTDHRIKTGMTSWCYQVFKDLLISHQVSCSQLSKDLMKGKKLLIKLLSNKESNLHSHLIKI